MCSSDLQTGVMIILEFHNRVIVKKLNSWLQAPSKCDLTVADFDGCLFHILCEESEGPITVSLSTRCGSQINATPLLKKIYGEHLLAQPIGTNDVSIRFDLNAVQDKGAFIMKVALLKRHYMSAPFESLFNEVEKGQPGKLIQIDNRVGESFFLQGVGDRVLVIFSINFADKDDIVYGRVFLQEFSRLLGGAPAVDAKIVDPPSANRPGRDACAPPKELQNVSHTDAGAYVTFVLEARHFVGKNRELTISLLQTFRNYLHYHIKCNKANLHIRMRKRVILLLQVLNRAKHIVEKDKKTATGRTFNRKKN